MLLVGTIIGGWSAPLLAQDVPAEGTETQATQPQPVPAEPAPSQPAPEQQGTPAQGAAAQPAPTTTAPQTTTLAAPQAAGTIRSISVRGSQRLEPATIISYSNLVPGQTYTAATLDQALKDLYATELFADVVITGAETGAIVITVQENPVINRIVLEGNKRLNDDKIQP